METKKHKNTTSTKEKKEIDIENKNKQHEYDKDGNIIVDLSIRNDVDFLSPYSLNGLPTISHEIGDFIESSTKTFPPKQKLTLRFHGMNVNNKEKETYKKAIKDYYQDKYLHMQQKIKKNNLFSLLFFIIGTLVIALALTIDFKVWSEVIDILAWVLLWEAMDIFLFRNLENRHDKNRYLKFTTMNVEFYS